MTCDFCEHPDDDVCIYPWNGSAPHEWVAVGNTTATVMSDKLKRREFWPDNFEENPDVSGYGTYTHCLECGDSA